MPQLELIEFVVRHQREMGVCELRAYDIQTRLARGEAVFEVLAHAFALIQVERTPAGTRKPHLWLLYVLPQARGRRLGRRFVRHLLSKHAGEHPMTLRCVGPRRRAFFGRAGFVVTMREGELRHMTSKHPWRATAIEPAAPGG